MKQLVAKAYAKVILVGEHAVLYGGTAVGMPVWQAETQIILRPADTKPHFNPPLLGALWRDALDMEGVARLAVSLELKNRTLSASGLGSSAAVCVAVLRGLATLLGRSMGPAELARKAALLEQRFHGHSSSGLDTHLVAYEQPLVFTKKEGARPLLLHPQTHSWHFAVIDSGQPTSTKKMIARTSAFFQDPVQSPQRLELFEEAAALAERSLTQGSTADLAEAMQQAGQLLTEAGLVPPQVQEICNTARAEGALAAKVTGAGGGGAVLVFLDPKQSDWQLSRLRSLFGSSLLFSTGLTANTLMHTHGAHFPCAASGGNDALNGAYPR